MRVKTKYSIASRNRWAKVPVQERKKIMAARAMSKWSKMSPTQQKRHIKKMVEGRLRKQGIK